MPIWIETIKAPWKAEDLAAVVAVRRARAPTLGTAFPLERSRVSAIGRHSLRSSLYCLVSALLSPGGQVSEQGSLHDIFLQHEWVWGGSRGACSCCLRASSCGAIKPAVNSMSKRNNDTTLPVDSRHER